MVVTFRTHYTLCKKCPETARDKLEYLQNLKTFIHNYKCIRFWKNSSERKGESKRRKRLNLYKISWHTTCPPGKRL